MIVSCPACASRFNYDENRFQDAPSKRFRCPKCSEVFEVANPVLSPITSMELPLEPETPQPPAPQPEPSQGLPDATEPVSVGSTTNRSRGFMAQSGLPSGRRWRVSLAFLNGPNASTVRQLDQPVVVIGREQGDIVTLDPETSRRHAQLEIHYDGSVWLTDLNSTNGTLIEGTRIQGTVQLQDRQEFTCGKSTFMLLVRSEDPMEL